MIGERLSHYRVTAKLGAGGMGEVYLAEDTKLGRQVALKVLPAELADDPGRLSRLQREARALAALDHPNIVTVFSVEEADGVHFLTMAYIEGDSLDALIPQDGFSPERLLELASSLADALRAAHEHGIVHRDLKPANIMIDKEGRLRVLDFGLARLERVVVSDELTALATETMMTRAGTLLGTYPYMSPEQTQGQVVDARSDIFSLGIILYEMATGNRPFAGDSAASVMSAILRDTPPPVDLERDDLPHDLVRILDRCLEKDPEDRYQRARALCKDLADLRRESVAGRSWAPSARLHGRLPVKRWALRIGGVVLALLLLAGVFEKLEILDLVAGWPPVSSQTASADPSLVAVFPFSVHGGAEYLSEAMVDLLGSLLNAGEVRSVDSHALLAVLRQQRAQDGHVGPPDPALARELAQSFGAGRFVLGHIVQTGDTLNVTAALYETAGPDDAVLQAVAQGKEEQVTAPLLQLATQILDTYATDLEPGVLTDDYEAMRAYLQGQKLYREGSWLEAAGVFREAVEEDPTFAMAHYKIAVSTRYLPAQFLPEDALEEVERALEAARQHGGLLPERKRGLIEAYHAAWVREDAGEGIQIAEDLVTRYPDEIDAWQLIGRTRYSYDPLKGDDLSAARRALERALAYDPTDVRTLQYLWLTTARQERYEDVAAFLERLHSGGENEPVWRLYLACVREDEATVEEAIDGIAREFPTRFLDMTSGTLGEVHRDPECSEKVARKLVEVAPTSYWQARGYNRLAKVALLRGQWRAARQRLEEMQAAGLDHPELAYQIASMKMNFYLLPFVPAVTSELESLRSVLIQRVPDSVEERMLLDYRLGHLNARLDGPSAAQPNVEKLQAIYKERQGAADSASRLQALVAGYLAHSVRAQVLWESGDHAEALTEIERMRLEDLWSERLGLDRAAGLILDLYFRAMMLEQQGRLEEALSWYRSIGYAKLHNGVWKAPMHFWLGRTHERLGNREPAVEHYSKFVDWWKDCGPELCPMVEEAREGIRRLGGESPQ
jgi:serine/threonine protein kinase